MDKEEGNEALAPSDAAVLAYLQKRGLIVAEKELKSYLSTEPGKQPACEKEQVIGDKNHSSSSVPEPQVDSGGSTGDSNNKCSTAGDDELDESKVVEQFEKNEAERDRDEKTNAKEQFTFLYRSSGGGLGYDLDSASTLPTWGVLSLAGIPLKDVDEEMRASGSKEATLYIESFTALQTWVLSLPDDPAVPGSSYSLTQQNSDNLIGKERNDNAMITLGKGVAEILQSANFTSNTKSLLHVIPPLPPSAKPELMAVCFPLLVHSYCELLEYGMEADAEAFLSAWKWLYLPLYLNELRDLERCNTTAKIVLLNQQIITHKEQHGKLRNARTQLDKLKSRHSAKDLLKHQLLVNWEKKVQEAMKNESQYLREIQSYPFLHRVRTSRMQISLSAYTYSLLAAFMARERLIPMSVLLMTKCHLSIEPRDPLPYTPACVLVDAITNIPDETGGEDAASATPKAGNETIRLPPLPAVSIGVNQEAVCWAAPSPLPELTVEAKDYDINSFPPLSDFNKSLLLNGFRRLEALKIKQEHIDDAQTYRGEGSAAAPRQELCDALSPSALLATCCAPSLSSTDGRLDTAAVEITCARFCPGDGRKIAIGCDDSAVRVWCLDGSSAATRKTASGKESVDGSSNPLISSDICEANILLVGHKGGWPVFGVDFCRDGRSLISCGGDGTVRLWDTAAVGPYGRLAKNLKKAIPKKPFIKGAPSPSPFSSAPGDSALETKRKPGVDIGGAALCVYRGHSFNTPIWDCRFAPSGYYFATCGGDTAGKIWTTDRPTPVRSLVGHLSSVNCIAWHPNVNYVVTGSDDKTCRMWDVQTGRCVRVLTGFHGWVTSLEVCPSGKYVAAADETGLIGMYDLASGRRVNEYNCGNGGQTLSFSACGTALASGGDDFAVRIWDVKRCATNSCVPEFAESLGTDLNKPLLRRMPRAGLDVPVKVFKTKRTVLLDLQYTNRNLLMCVGKYVTPL